MHAFSYITHTRVEMWRQGREGREVEQERGREGEGRGAEGKLENFSRICLLPVSNLNAAGP